MKIIKTIAQAYKRNSTRIETAVQVVADFGNSVWGLAFLAAILMCGFANAAGNLKMFAMAMLMVEALALVGAITPAKR